VNHSNIGPISHRFRDMTTYSSKLSIKHQGSRQRPIRWYYRRPPMTYRLATVPHDWHTIVR